MDEGGGRRWLWSFLPLAWSGHASLGLALGVFGPTQPYLARQVGVKNEEINLIWTGRSLGVCLICVVTSLTIRHLATASWQKLVYLAVSQFLCAIFILLVPWIGNFYWLLAASVGIGFGIGGFDTADNILMVYTLGPAKSRPLLQSLHAFVATGFVLGSLLVHPFLPGEDSSAGQSSVCSSTNNSLAANDTDGGQAVNSTLASTYVDGVADIVWPFVFISAAHLVVSIGFFVLGLLNLPLPRYYVDVPVCDSSDEETDKKVTLRQLQMLLLAYLYFAMSCGLEGFFQSQIYTFGMCGPQELSSSQAATLSTVYFSLFLTGRIIGVPLSSVVSPDVMVYSSILGCLAGAVLLTQTASHLIHGLFIGTGLMGFFISFQFASGYSWLAQRLDLTGVCSGVVFLGANSGWFVFPPLAGYMFASRLGPMSLFYLTLGCCTLHLAIFLLMVHTSDRKVSRRSES